MMKLFFLPLLFTVALFSADGSEVAVSVQSDPPAEKAISSFENQQNPNAVAWFYTDTARRDIAQSFTVHHTTTMQSITLRIQNVRNNFTSASEFTFEVYEANSLTENPKHGHLLQKETGQLQLARGNQEMYLTFSLEQPINLAEGRVYTVILTLNTPSLTNILSFITNEGYKDGARWSTNEKSELGELRRGKSDSLVFYIQ